MSVFRSYLIIWKFEENERTLNGTLRFQHKNFTTFTLSSIIPKWKISFVSECSQFSCKRFQFNSIYFNLFHAFWMNVHSTWFRTTIQLSAILSVYSIVESVHYIVLFFCRRCWLHRIIPKIFSSLFIYFPLKKRSVNLFQPSEFYFCNFKLQSTALISCSKELSLSQLVSNRSLFTRQMTAS